jgi:hypothetical protein
MSKLLTLLSLIFSLISFSQDLATIFNDTINTGNEIRITSLNYYSSNGFNNELTNKFIFGGNISNEIKDFNQGKLGSINSLGAESEQKIEYVNYNIIPFKKWSNLGIIFSIEDLHFVSSNLSTDLYNTLFYGNSPYVGDTMDFSYSHLQYQHYQKISFGLIHNKYKSSLKISFVNANKGIDYRLGNTWMYSSPLSDSINFNLNAEGHYTPGNNPYFSTAGAGFALDLNHNFIYYNKNEKRQVINFKLGNIGFIYWNDETNYNFVDSSNTYSGFEIMNLITKDSASNLLTTDTLGIFSTTRNQIELLPFELSIQKLADRYASKKLQLIFGFKSIISSDYRPYIFVGGYYSPNQKFGISSRLAYGGFGGFKLGLNANYWVKDKFEIALGTYDLVGFASSKYGFGKSLNFSTLIKF